MKKELLNILDILEFNNDIIYDEFLNITNDAISSEEELLELSLYCFKYKYIRSINNLISLDCWITNVIKGNKFYNEEFLKKLKLIEILD